MAFLFDTDAISELLRPHPLTAYRNWIETVERQDQFTSAVVVGELYKGACRSANQEKHLVNIENRNHSFRRTTLFYGEIGRKCALMTSAIDWTNSQALHG